MERITISVDPDLAAEFDSLVESRGYQNRSEAVRDVLREYVERNRLRDDRARHCVACVSYVYNHNERDLATRIIGIQHDHHDLTVASMHTHIGHEDGLEVLFLKGPTKAVRECSDQLLAQTGVRHGEVNLVPVEEKVERHTHPATRSAVHTHLRPKS